MADDQERGGSSAGRRGGLIAAVAVGIAAAVGVGVANLGAGDASPANVTAASSSPSPTSSASVGPTTSSAPSPDAATSPPPALRPGVAPGAPVITKATAADLQWTRADGFLTCSGLVINVRVRTTGEVTRVLALLLRISGGATTRLSLSGSNGTWSQSSLELNAPSVWRIKVVALGPGGRDEQFATVTAPDDSGTTLRHVCAD